MRRLGYQDQYKLDYDFRLWFKQFSALALIPLENLEEAFAMIMSNSRDYLIDDNMKKFVSYFIDQWLVGEVSPEVWNHFRTSQRRTNNDLEGKFHFWLLVVRLDSC
jgi:hypothetical protein